MTMIDQNSLNTHLATWNLSNPQLIAQTHTSHIYTVTHQGETAILKLLSPTETEEQIGALALRYFSGHGAVHLLHHDDAAQLLEYASGDELITLVERGEDEAATRIIAQVLKQLHGIPQDAPCAGLFTLERWFRELFNKAAADKQAGRASIYVRGASVAQRLLSDPRDRRVLHGDIHHRNIRQSSRGWLAFDPKGLVGERAYDCANTLCNPPIPELAHNERRLLANAAILADALEIDVQRILEFTYAYACLNASWWVALNNDEIVQWSLRVAEIIEPHITSKSRS